MSRRVRLYPGTSLLVTGNRAAAFAVFTGDVTLARNLWPGSTGKRMRAPSATVLCSRQDPVINEFNGSRPRVIRQGNTTFREAAGFNLLRGTVDSSRVEQVRENCSWAAVNSVAVSIPTEAGWWGSGFHRTRTRPLGWTSLPPLLLCRNGL